MALSIYSDLVKARFNTMEEAEAAEKAYTAKLEEEEKKKKELPGQRKIRAKEVEDAYKAIVEAEKKYSELKTKFIKDYGSFHMSFSSADDGFDWFFNDFFKVF